MTRLVHQPVTVETDSETGAPACVDGVPVRQVLDHFREWIGILQGEPERDIWRVELPRGICEVHLIRHGGAVQEIQPDHRKCEALSENWLLARWED